MASHGEVGFISRRTMMQGGAALAISPLTGCVWLRPPPQIIGYLDPLPADNAANGTKLAAFRKGLAEQGIVDGDNAIIEYRYADGQPGRIAALAKELVDLKVAVLVADTRGAARAFQALTTTIPIVFCQVGDAVESGEVSNPEHPEANLTGIANTNELGPKRLWLLDRLVPQGEKIAYLADSSLHSYERTLKEIEGEAERLKRRLVILRTSNDTELAGAYAKLSGRGVGGLVVGSMRGLRGHPERLVSLAARRNIPAIYYNRAFVDAGGLMSYGAAFAEIHRLAGVYAGRILNGAHPADLPVLNPHAVELVINMQTAKALGVVIPPDILSGATIVG